MNRLFKLSKSLLPRISNTEMIALRSGTVSIDRNIMANTVGVFPFDKLENKIDQDYLNNEVKELYQKTGDKAVFQNGSFNPNLKSLIQKTKAFSYIIDEKYDGYNFNVETQSRILVKLASYNPSLGVTVMVPNSLGPGELLQHYGTETQKNNYLPKLANGTFIPCFGLTGPYNGSDVAGPMDAGIVVKKGDKIFIDAVLNKRYITLAPIANLMGVAIKVSDPDNLLNQGKEGITLALLEKEKYENLKNSSFHNPMNAGFPNGTLKGNVLIELEDVIGGPEKIGHGWKMLMECLAAGRGVSLPASSLGACLATTYGITGYANIRKQFNISIAKMEGVYEKLYESMYNTMIIDSKSELK